MAEPEEHQQAAPEADAGRGKTVHGAAANAGHRVLAPDDAEVEAYLEVALDAPAPDRAPTDPPMAAVVPEPGVVAVLDFGSQFAQLIARRVRELNVYSELLPHDTPLAELERRGCRAIILSGGPNSVYDEAAPRADASIWSGRLPVLGICYGAQLMALELGGDVHAGLEARVRSGDRPDHPRRRPVRRHRPRAAGLDEPRRFDHADPGGLPRHGADGVDRRTRAWPRRSATCTASSSTPRSSTRRAVGTSCATS